MKKSIKDIFLLFIFLFLTTNLFSQNAFSVVKTVIKKPKIFTKTLNIQRVTVVETNRIEQAIKAAELQSRFRYQKPIDIQHMETIDKVGVEFLTQSIEQKSCKPEELYGGYNYLKMCSKNMGGSDWKNINKTKAYNGVHHIINVQTLKVLYKESLLSYEKKDIVLYPFFNEMVLNAPAIFHSMHNKSGFQSTFHNIDEQLILYKYGGIKSILDSFFKSADELNRSMGLKLIDDDIKIGTYLEAELWSKTYGLTWEK